MYVEVSSVTATTQVQRAGEIGAPTGSRRRVRLLAAAVSLVALLTAGLSWTNRMEAVREQDLLARLHRQAALVDRLLDGYAADLARVAERVAASPKFLGAYRAGRADAALAGCWPELAAAGARAVWLIDRSGRPIATAGMPVGFADTAGHPGVAAALAGGAARGLLPGRAFLALDAAVPVPEPPGGALRVARALDDSLGADLEALTEVRLTALPQDYVLSPVEVALARREGTVEPILGRVRHRAEALCRDLSIRHDQRPVLFQQLCSPDDRPAGLVALSVRADDLRPRPTATLLALVTVLALVVLLSASSASCLPRFGRSTWWLRAEPIPDLRPRDDGLLRTLAHGLSHHLNNSLAVVVGNGELAQRTASDPRSREAMGDVVESALRAAGIIRLVQRSVDRERLVWTVPVDLATVFRDALGQTVGRLDGQRSVTAVGLDGMVVAGLVDDLVEVLTQLLTNAWQATTDGGRIVVRAQPSGGVVTVSVSDDGEGMTAYVRRRAAEPFFTTRGPRFVGLGLSAVDGIVARHGGRWWIDSQPGCGCVVTVVLPRWQGPEAAHGAAGPADSRGSE